MKKNLLELCLSPDLGGLELYMVRSAKALNDAFNVISVINPNGKLEQYYEGTGFRYEMVEKNSNLLMFSAARKLAKIIDENAIDIIHMHWTKDIPVTVLAKKLSKCKPKIVQTRNMTMTRFKNDFYHQLLYKNIDLMLPVTKQVEGQLKRFIPETIRPKVEVLYMGTDEVELLNEEALHIYRQQHGMDKGFAIGLVGRIEETKGQHLLIDAIALLHQKGVMVDAFFVGHEMEEGYIEILKEKAKEHGVASAVHFPGFMKNPMHFMQACDVMVLATLCETFGLVVIEAMSVATPMVATDACGPLEIIEDERSGLLFKKDDSVSLSQKIELLYSDRKKSRALGLAGQQRVQDSFLNTVQFQKLGTILENT